MFNEKFLEKYAKNIEGTMVWWIHGKNPLNYEIGKLIWVTKTDDAYLFYLRGTYEMNGEESFWMRFLNSDYNGD